VAIVLTLPQERFLALLEDHSDLAHSAMGFLGDKVRRKTARLANLEALKRTGSGEPLAVFDAKPYDQKHLTEVAGGELAPS
jgi:hypothetical protein